MLAVSKRTWMPTRSRRRGSRRSKAAIEVGRTPTRDDPLLIDEVRESSITAFEELYDRYCTRAWRVALSVCGDERHAEDAVEDAFVSIWTNARSYRADRGTVAAWLLSTVRNRAVAHVRDEQANRDSRAAIDPSSPESPGVGVEAEALERARVLRALLDGLPDAEREAITLALYGELTTDEIATCLGLSPEAVKGRIRGGLRKLATEKEGSPTIDEQIG